MKNEEISRDHELKVTKEGSSFCIQNKPGKKKYYAEYTWAGDYKNENCDPSFPLYFFVRTGEFKGPQSPSKPKQVEKEEKYQGLSSSLPQPSGA